MKKICVRSFYVACAILGSAAVASAADVPFTVTAPAMDFTVMGTVATSMLGLAVAILGYRKVRSMLGR